jgi:hypothetical protein
LDWGLQDPNQQYRGWGGGNSENAIIGEFSSSRSYLIGAMSSGTWNVVVGKPRIATPPGHMSIYITIRDAPTLKPQTQRQPYVKCPPLDNPSAPQWYAGDFHIHSRESGDAFVSATLDEIADFGRDKAGLDFVHISDHNTVSVADFIVDAQTRHPHTLILPGVEYTTYFGHGGAMFTTKYVDHKLGVNSVTIESAVAAIHAQGGLFSINHFDMYEPDSKLRNSCVGCAWDLAGAMSLKNVDAIEIAIQKWSGVGFIFSPQAIQYWDHLHALGFTQIAPIGGSDDHHGGQNETVIYNWKEGSSLGSPTTMVLAQNLSHDAIYEGIKSGRTVVKMECYLDPDLDLIAVPFSDSGLHEATTVRVGGFVRTHPTVSLTAFVQERRSRFQANQHHENDQFSSNKTTSMYVVLVRNNEETITRDIVYENGTNAFNFTVVVPAPISGTDRWRAEIHDKSSGILRTITNHIFISM